MIYHFNFTPDILILKFENKKIYFLLCFVNSAFNSQNHPLPQEVVSQLLEFRHKLRKETLMTKSLKIVAVDFTDSTNKILPLEHHGVLFLLSFINKHPKNVKARSCSKKFKIKSAILLLLSKLYF